MNRFSQPEKLVLSMIQPEPLPGSYRHTNQTIEEIVEKALQETQMVADNGFDGIILQNMNDMPIKQQSNFETVAYMTRIGLAIKERFPQLILGILVNWDGVASLAVADAIGADFVRVEHLFTGASVTSAGILQAQCIEIMNLRKKIGSNIPVYADIFEVHGVPLGAKSVENAAWEAVNEAFADGLFLAGSSTEESIELIKKVRTKLPNTPIILGGGATGDNITELMSHYDGVSVATWVKNGDMKNPIDPRKAQIFIENAKKIDQ